MDQYLLGTQALEFLQIEVSEVTWKKCSLKINVQFH